MLHEEHTGEFCCNYDARRHDRRKKRAIARVFILFAAVHESAVGTPRRFAAARKFGRDRSEADMPRASGACRSDGNDLDRTWGSSVSSDAKQDSEQLRFAPRTWLALGGTVQPRTA